MLKIYLDNDVASATSRRDWDKAELDPIDQLVEWHRDSKIVLGTSRQSPREMEGAPAEYQDKLKKGLSELGLAADDHRVLGFSTLIDRFGS